MFTAVPPYGYTAGDGDDDESTTENPEDETAVGKLNFPTACFIITYSDISNGF